MGNQNHSVSVTVNAERGLLVITPSDLVSAIKLASQEVLKESNNAGSGNTKAVKASFSNNGRELLTELEIKDIQKLAALFPKDDHETDIALKQPDLLKKCFKLVSFMQDFGINKEGFFNDGASSLKFKLEPSSTSRFFNVRRKKPDKPDIMGLDSLDKKPKSWTYNDVPPADADRKITGMQNGTVLYNTENAASDKIADWVFISQKSGGANLAGEDGGIYKRGDLTALIKQEAIGKQVDNASNICEFLGSFMFQHAAPGSGAKVFLATNNDTENLPDKNGENIYVGSIFFENYKDLYVDAYENVLSLPAPKNRPRIIGNNIPKFKRALREGNYTGFADIMPLSLLIGDFDVHWGNVGAVRGPGNQRQPRLVRIDFGWAFKSDFSEEVHPHSTSRHLPGLGPTNHFHDYPNYLKINPEFVAGLKKITSFDFKPVINEGIEEVSKYYGTKPLQQFAKRIGMRNVGSLNNYQELISAINYYITNRIIERQTSLKNFTTEIEMDLLFSKDDGKGHWHFTSYQDTEGNKRTIEDAITANRQYFADILSGKKSVHFRAEDHRKSGYWLLDILDIFGLSKMYFRYIAKQELKKYTHLVYPNLEASKPYTLIKDNSDGELGQIKAAETLAQSAISRENTILEAKEADTQVQAAHSVVAGETEPKKYLENITQSSERQTNSSHAERVRASANEDKKDANQNTRHK